MTVKECYEFFGGNYDEAIGRLAKDERVLKYLRKFADGDDFTELDVALKEERYEDAFRHVHNLKGMSLNLALTPLAKSSDILCEALRGGKPSFDVSGMLSEVKETYKTVTDAIRMIEG